MCIEKISLSIGIAAVLLIAMSSADAQLEPPAGRVISGWGQLSSAWDLGQPAGKGESDNLEAYSKAGAPHAPAMISFYAAADTTILAPFLVRYREFAAHGFFVADIGLYFHGMERDVSTGMRDPELLILADGLRDVGRPVLLRIGYEFNAPSAPYEPSAYIGAFRHATEVLRKDHLNFATVWDATAMGLSTSHYMKWYPGDDVVDWWAINLFDLTDFTRADGLAFVGDAARHHKPVMIIAAPGTVKSEAQALKWYASFFEFIRAHPSIKAFSLHPTVRLARWPKIAAYVKQQLADPRFIDAKEAAVMFRPPPLPEQ
jgi:hypothetical protein